MTDPEGCSNATKFDSICSSHVVGQVYMYFNRKTIVCGLPDANRQRYIDKFKSLGIDKASLQDSENYGGLWMEDSVAPQKNGVTASYIANDITAIYMSFAVPSVGIPQ